jgi:adenosine receptor A2a
LTDRVLTLFKQNKPNLRSNQSHKAFTRITKTFAIIFGVVIVCWTPIQVSYLIVGLSKDPDFLNHWAMRVFYVFSILLTHFTSAINPFVYAYRIRNVRTVMKKALRIKVEPTPSVESSIGDPSINLDA